MVEDHSLRSNSSKVFFMRTPLGGCLCSLRFWTSQMKKVSFFQTLAFLLFTCFSCFSYTCWFTLSTIYSIIKIITTKPVFLFGITLYNNFLPHKTTLFCILATPTFPCYLMQVFIMFWLLKCSLVLLCLIYLSFI